jgi:hypothetical protein
MRGFTISKSCDARGLFCRIALLLAFCALLAPLPAAALTIDDFEDGDFAITDTTPAGPPATDSQGSLAGVLGGSREGSVNLASGVSASLSVSGGALTASADNPAVIFFQVRYDGIANGVVDATGAFTVDLTEGGINDRFILEVISLIGATDVTIALSEPGTSVVTVETFPVTAIGTVEILFADFPSMADFTNVDSVLLQAGGGGGTFANGERISFGSFEAVPEPGSVLLLAAGLAGLAARHRIGATAHHSR